MHRRGLVKGVSVGDYIKGWDILSTAAFMETNVPRSAPVLDIGAYGSEMLCVMHRLKYSNLSGVDLNSELSLMPFADKIRYQVSDFMHTPFESESFEAVTAISVIEHGFQGQSLLTEVSRLLRPGGYFIASFDYWPDKLNTDEIRIFDMDWRIFSRSEVLDLIAEARHFGLAPFGEIDLDAQERPVSAADKHYTFAWMVLRKHSAAS